MPLVSMIVPLTKSEDLFSTQNSFRYLHVYRDASRVTRRDLGRRTVDTAGAFA